MYAVTGGLLRVDLGTRRCAVESLPERLYRQYLGGYGLGAGLCLFGYFILSYKTLPEFLGAADGTQWSMQELEQAGLRLTLARQVFNLRAGWTLDRYGFPERALGRPALRGGETQGVQVDLKTMLREYLEHAGLDARTGLPETAELERLGLAACLP